MDLSHGLPTVAIPGPSILPERVRQAMARPMPDIYAGDLLDVSERILETLPRMARTAGHTFVLTSNGHGAWQMALSNTIVPGDKVLVLESGRFAVVWGENAALAGADVEVLHGDFRAAVDPAALEERLKADTSGSIHAILVAHTDTASSVRNDIAELRAAIDRTGHGALLMVDCIASLGCERFEMDEWGVDVTVAASQKGLMCPPGMGFVWAGPRAIAAWERIRDSGAARVGYMDWGARIDPEVFYQTYAGTPPVAHLYALDAAFDLIEEEGGLEAAWRRHEAIAGAVRAAIGAWSGAGAMELNIECPEHRSNAVTTILCSGWDAEELRDLTKNRAGVTLGVGIGGRRRDSFRVGHMGHVNAPMILGTLGTIEAGLVALGVPTGASGAAAAAESLGRLLTE